MQGLVIVDQGLEETAILELKELINAKASILEPCVVEFPIKKTQDLRVVCYKAQSVRHVLLLLSKAPCKPDFNQLAKVSEKLVKEVDWKEWVKKDHSFKCVAEHLEETDFNSMDMEKEVGGHIFDALKSLKLAPKVNLKTADLSVFSVLGKKDLYLGIDFAGRDLSKRSYKIYHHASALKGTLGYGVVRFSGFKPGQVLIDPFAGSGIIPIEAALFTSGFSVNHFSKEFAFQALEGLKMDEKEFEALEKVNESLPVQGADHLLMHIKSAQNNAKIAGVDKWTKFSKGEVEWMDTQFKKVSVDHIVTHPPEPSQQMNEKDVEKVYREFFYQADFILKKEGSITALVTKKSLFLKMAQEKKFVVNQEKKVWSGKMMYHMLRLGRA
ncbi:MAG: THUMP domain-containing protein [Nanoarchaeota archaeon]